MGPSRGTTTLILLVFLIEFSTPIPRRGTVRPSQPGSPVTPDWCKLPPPPEHGFYFVSQHGNNFHQDPTGTYVPHGWLLKYTCNSNYILSTNNSESTCDHGRWRNMVDCIKLCDPLSSSNAELTCEYGGWVVPCSKPMWPHTKVSVKCKEGYHSQHSEDHGGVECDSKGMWDYPVDHCRPGNQNRGSSFGMAGLGEIVPPEGESFAAFSSTPASFPPPETESGSRSWRCGIPAEEEGHTTLIVDGSPTYPGAYPWLSAIYVRMDNEWTQICGGTLITPRIVLTAAHCLVNENARLNSPNSLRVGLGKFYRDYYKKEANSKMSDVKQLTVPRDYKGPSSNYVLDIGLISLTEQVPLSPFIMPACFDWDEELRLKTGDLGHIVGWGITENGSSSDTILSAELTYITNSLCRQQIKGSNEKYLTYEKFCAGSNEGSVNNGDSGGGITFIKNNRHYVFGVVSSKISQATTFSLFTDASHREHHAWVLRERERFEKSH